MKTILAFLFGTGVLGVFAGPYEAAWDGKGLTLEDARISSVPFCRVWPGHQREKSQTEMSHFVRFDWTKDGVFTVKGKGVGKALKDLLPLSAREIAKPAGDDALTLAIGRPGAYVLEFDGLPTLHVFADPPLAPVPAPGPGGKLIRFAKGEHHPGVVAPKSGDVVVLDEGAVVYSSLFVLNATNVTVTGRGIFDGSKLERADESMRAFRRANGLPEIDTESACFAYSVYGSENVTISGVTFRDPPFWTLVVRNQCRKTLVDNIHIVGNWRYNSDGIDVCASAETEIRNSFIRTFDDCVIARGPYLKGEFAPVSGMTVTNCDLWADWGVVFKAQVQDFHGSTIEDVTMRDCRFMNLQDSGIFLAVRYGCDLDVIRRMTFEDLEYDFRRQLRPKIQKKDGETFVSSPLETNYLLYGGSYTLGKNLDNQQNAPMEDPNYYRFIFEDIACRRIKTFGEKRELVVHFKADVPRHEIRRVTVEDVPPHRLSRSRRVEIEDRTALDTTAERVRADFTNYAERAVVHYALPAMSESQRLPDAYPEDGQAGAVLRIRAAKGEYEPCAFGLWATRDLGKVRLEVGDLKQVERKGGGGGGGGGGSAVVFPKEKLDLKFVKCWYQNLNGWFSYFSDNGFKLVPELLLHNEELIRCDDAKKANYARVIGSDGRTAERWLNPPQKMDRLISPNVPWRTREPFQPMRPGFHDADKLQPVTLPKEEFRAFFLTAHVTKDIPAGLYKGEVKIHCTPTPSTYTYSIPIELEVLDFELPSPKSYLEPQTDFLVSFYSYDELGNICEYNGGDVALARRQLSAVLENQVAHGQSVHMMGGNFSGEVIDTVKRMTAAGMRPDLIHGGIQPSRKYGLTHEETAKILRAECDRRFGHHNVYMMYGDEPGVKWLQRERPVLKTYLEAGLKFCIAGSDSVYYKDGHLFDWHNIAQDPAKGFSAPLWNAVGENHVAWYAQQHVGSENPAFNRRQNGMGAYLSGYTALCNYAHHFGEYNDDRATYRPMVFAYGTDNGVIDTIQWEGFREGIDDIRYATLLTQLARRARKSSVPAARQLGARALQYLATFDRGAGDLDTCRAEMIACIQGLLAYEKPDPIVPVARPQPKPDEADRLFAEEMAPLSAKLAAAKTVAETNACVKALQNACRKRYRYEDLLAVSERLGEPYGVIEAAEQLFDDEKADAARMRIYRSRNLPSRLSIVSFLGELMVRHPDLEKEPAFAAALYNARDTNALVRSTWSDLGKCSRWMRDAYFPVWKRFYAVNAAMADRVGEKGMDGEAAKLGVEACVATADWTLLQKIVARALENEKLKPADRHALGLAAVFLRPEVLGQKQPNVEALLKTVDAAAVPNADRVKAIQSVGAWAMLANGEAVVRGLETCRKGLYRPSPKKRYRVRHSSVPVEGPTAWTRLDCKPEAAVYDRTYGGSLEFLTTDVTTGTRATGNSKEKLEPARMQVVTDEWGLHFRLDCPDPKAREVESGFVDGGSFETYLAPGRNKPYVTMTITPGRDAMSVFNTQYETFGHRRFLGEKPETYRLSTTYGASNVVIGLSIPWEAYASYLPEDGAVWDFENIYWNRAGNCAWNGTETIHGRSTWGELVFEMPEAARIRILRRLGRKACLAFMREVKSVHAYEGCVVHWQDDEVGDPAFYEKCLKDYVAGLVEKADAFRKDPTDELVRAYDADGTIARWRDIFFEVSRRRAQWLGGRRSE